MFATSGGGCQYVFFFFLNQFVFRDTSLRLGPVCNYEPLQVMRQYNIEVPTRQVKERETTEAWKVE
jgi:hypothetical protein